MPGRPAFSSWLLRLTEDYSALNDLEKNATLDKLISVSGSSQLYMLSSHLPHYVYRDFISNLPLEISLQILQFLDGKELCACCQVSHTWNERISESSTIWMVLAKDIGVDISSLGVHKRPLRDANDTYRDDFPQTSCLGLQYKSLYLHATRILKGLQCGTSVVIRDNFIEKETWRITSVRYHNGNVLTGCDDHTVQIWSVPDGTVLNSISTNSVCCLTITGNRLYTASFNSNAECWNLLSGLHRKTFSGHTSAVLAIDVMQDETFLLTGSVDKTAKLWDLRIQDSRLVKTFDSVHEGWVFHVKFLPKEENHLLMVSCDSSLCCLWKTDFDGNILSSSHIAPEGSAKFTSFYHRPDDLCHMFACQWTDWIKSSSFFEYEIKTKSPCIVRTQGFQISLDSTKASLLGAGLKFAVIMCSISRKDFHVLHIQKHVVIASIATPYFYILTRNLSTVTLCNTTWLDGFNFSEMQDDVPIFAALIAIDRVMLGTWAKHVAEVNNY